LEVLSASRGGGDVTHGQVEAPEKVLLALSEFRQEQIASPQCIQGKRRCNPWAS